MSETDFTLRTATPADAAALAELGARTFREAFGAQNSAEDMDAYLASAYSPAAQLEELSDPGWHTLLVESEGVAVAFAQLREGPPPECVTGPDPVELYRIYVDGPWQGRGVARVLLEEVMREARRRGGRTLHLGVWEHNHRALAFYARHGFTRVGEREFMLGSARDTDHVMSRPI